MSAEGSLTTWREVPRYVGYDILARTCLPPGPDFELVSRCHRVMLDCVRYRDSHLCLSISERRCASPYITTLEDTRRRQRVSLGELVLGLAHLPARTDCGLTWKGDALIHLIDDFDVEGMPELSPFVRAYVKESTDRISREISPTTRGGALPTIDLRRSEYCSAIYDAHTAVMHCGELIEDFPAILEFAACPAKRPEEAEDELEDAHRQARRKLERCRYLCPTCLADILALAQLILVLINDETGEFHQRIAASDFSRSLANAVRCAIGVRLSDQPFVSRA